VVSAVQSGCANNSLAPFLLWRRVQRSSDHDPELTPY
jgi:hypothetical protein